MVMFTVPADTSTKSAHPHKKGQLESWPFLLPGFVSSNFTLRNQLRHQIVLFRLDHPGFHQVTGL